MVILTVFCACGAGALWFIHREERQRLLTEQALYDSQARLEALVAERTAELLATNEHLHNEIEQHRQFQAALAESEERYLLAVRGSNDGIWDWPLTGDSLYLSLRWKAMLGYADDEFPNSVRAWWEQTHPDDRERLRVASQALRDGHSLDLTVEYRMQHRNGEYRWFLTRGSAVRNLEGKITRAAGSHTDITQRKRIEEQLVHDALHDALTGLPNRVLFLDRLAQASRLTARQPDQLFGVLFLDLDRFKVVNDNLGHSSGDRLLVEVAQRIESGVRPTDTFARLGGDEFAILAYNIRHVGNITMLADRILARLEDPFEISGNTLYTNASIGIALSSSGYDSPEALLRDADIAMYRAKNNGGACYEIFDASIRTEVSGRLTLETDLRLALKRNEFCVYYQPLVDLKRGGISGFEALVRWQHPSRGLVSPAEFIPLAEETGMILPLGMQVLRTACAQLREWQTRLARSDPLSVSVNLSLKQFNQADLVEQVADVLQQAEIDAEQLGLGLEITETAIMQNLSVQTEMLRQLRGLGTPISIDDFGTGYSSLSYLHRLPIDTLKIDRSFVSRVGEDHESTEIVRTVVALGRSLGLKVVAEGVETATHLACLREMECDYGQGYLFSRPVNAAQAETLLQVDPRW